MSLFHQLLQKLMRQVARFVCAFPLAILIASLIFAAISLWIVITGFNVVNNTSDLLNDNSPHKKPYLELVKEFGNDSHFIVMIHSPDVVKNRQAADEVGAYLTTLAPQIHTVLTKIDYSQIKSRLLFLRDQASLEQAAQQVEAQAASVKTDQAQNQQIALDLNSILDEANKKFDDKYLRDKKNWTNFGDFVTQFVSILNKVSDQAEGKKAPHIPNFSDKNANFEDVDADEMLAQNEYYNLQDGQTILVLAWPGEPDKDADTPFSKTVEKIRQHLVEMEAHYPGMSLKLTGEPVLDADQIADANTDITRASAITITLILALFFFSYRSLLRPAFTFGALILAVLWTFCFAIGVIGHFNILSVAVIPMVLGIGIDFGIQVLGRYEEELKQGKSVEDAISQTLQHTGLAIIAGGSTTATAFFTLCFNDFIGLSELGAIAAASMILCIAASLVVLPALFVLRERNFSPQRLRDSAANVNWHFIHTWDHDLVTHPRLWLGFSALVSLAAIFSLPYINFDYNLLHLQNPKAPSVQTLYEVMNASKNNNDQVSTIYASVVVDNLDEARSMEAKLKQLPLVAKVDSFLPLIPPDQESKLPIINRIIKAASELNVKPSSTQKVDIARARRDTASLLKQAQDGETQAKAYLGVSKIARQAVDAFATMIPALKRANAALNSAPENVLQQRFSSSSEGAFNVFQKNLQLLKTQKADRPITLDDVPEQLKKLFLAPSGKILLQVYGKKDLWEHDADRDFVEQILTVAPQATGTPVLNYFATDLLITSYLHASVWAFVAIVALILLHFQSFKYLLLTLTPLVLAVLWRTGAMVWFGIEFNPANIVTLPLIIGIDVAFGIYIVDRFREDGHLSIFSGSTGKAIIMSALTSFFGFVSLLIANFRGVYDIGVLMSLGIAIGLVTSIIILPQILALLSPAPKKKS